MNPPYEKEINYASDLLQEDHTPATVIKVLKKQFNLSQINPYSYKFEKLQ